MGFKDSFRTELDFASSATSQPRIPSSSEILGQVQLYGSDGVSAEKIAGTIGVQAAAVVAVLHSLKLEQQVEDRLHADTNTTVWTRRPERRLHTPVRPST